MWWADKLRQGRPGAGIGEKEAEDAMAFAASMFHRVIPGATEEQISKFESLLAERFDSELSKSGLLELYRDYHTPPMIRETMTLAGIHHSWDIKFPCKTGMKIGKTTVTLKDGYGAHYERVFP